MIVLILDLDTEKLYCHEPDVHTLKALMEKNNEGLEKLKQQIEADQLVQIKFGEDRVPTVARIFKIRTSEIFVSMPQVEGGIVLEDWRDAHRKAGIPIR